MFFSFLSFVKYKALFELWMKCFALSKGDNSVGGRWKLYLENSIIIFLSKTTEYLPTFMIEIEMLHVIWDHYSIYDNIDIKNE